jgi:multiple sugar transport system permease protein
MGLLNPARTDHSLNHSSNTSRTFSQLAGSGCLYAILVVVTIIMLTPLIWMALSSFKSMGEIEAIELQFFPQQWTLGNYSDMTQVFNFGLYFRNSLIIALLSVVLVCLVSSWMGFVFARFDFWGKKYVFMSFLATLMIPGTVTIIPLYVVILRLGLGDTLWGLILPGIVSPFGIFLMRQFIAEIPTDLLDAARIDGCSDFRIYFQIILPLIRPAIAALSIFVFIGSWDNFLWPLIVLSSETWKPLPLGLALFAEEYFTKTNLAMAGVTVSVIPVLIFYILLQRQFVRGISMTGLSGV